MNKNDEKVRLLAQEQRLHEELEVLGMERARLAQAMAAQIRDLDRVREELARRQQELNLERDQFRTEQARTERRWKRRWDTELTAIQKEAGALAAERSAFEQDRLRAQGEMEMNRRQLEAGWSQLRREQETWREQKRQQEAQLRDQWHDLAQQQEKLQQAREQWQDQRRSDEASKTQLLEELANLENRIRNQRRQLTRLHEESLEQEDRIMGLGPQPVAAGAGPAGNLDRRAAQSLAEVAQDLLDHVQQLSEERALLLGLRQSWQWEWDRGLAEQARREEELRHKEASLEPRLVELRSREDLVLRRTMELERRQQEVQAREGRLARRQRALQCERGRLLAVVRARAAAARDRHELAIALRQRWLEQQRVECTRYQQELAALGQLRDDYARLRAIHREKLTEVERRERAALEQEMVLLQAEQQLLYDDPDPVAAAKELERRRAAWEQKALWPVRALEKEKRELDLKVQQIWKYHAHLTAREAELEQEHVAQAKQQAALEIELAEREAERIRWLRQLEALRGEKTRLQDHINELESEVERLVLAMMGIDQPRPALALAA
jgi:chromosome segregation ATPase